jgi:hypothetical protein
MERKSLAQIIRAASVELTVMSRVEHVNVDHRLISQAKDMGRNRGTRAQELSAENTDFLPILRQLNEEPDYCRSKLLRPIPEFHWQSSLVHSKTRNSKQTRRGKQKAESRKQKSTIQS